MSVGMAPVLATRKCNSGEYPGIVMDVLSSKLPSLTSTWLVIKLAARKSRYRDRKEIEYGGRVNVDVDMDLLAMAALSRLAEDEQRALIWQEVMSVLGLHTDYVKIYSNKNGCFWDREILQLTQDTRLFAYNESA
jgi:hypothetical protein